LELVDERLGGLPEQLRLVSAGEHRAADRGLWIEHGLKSVDAGYGPRGVPKRIEQLFGWRGSCGKQ